MIARIETVFRAMLRWTRLSEWRVRLLGLSKTVGEEAESGLVMIQIDGLSQNRLESAVDSGKMPFLKYLQKREGYRVHTLYSGLPASTPAVQGELFYGIRNIVPAFSFKDRKNGKIVRMFDPESVAEIQKDLEKKGPGLLSKGSSYTNIFSGGAKESHFCPATMGWDHLSRTGHPLSSLIFLLSNSLSLIRTGILLVLECFLAGVDCVRGLIDGKDMWKELKFVPTRVGISILLRDLVTLGACMDVTRGFPIVHLNFIGYDEQAHRRGPDSNFARWCLKGIDNCIRRIVLTARKSPSRDYDVWIYSDHGQEQTIPYPKENGKTVQETVARVYQGMENPPPSSKKLSRGVQFERSRWLGTSILNWLLGDKNEFEENDPSRIVVTAMGSLGHVYTPDAMHPNDRDQLAQKLVADANIPLVLAPGSDNTAKAWTGSCQFQLPEDAHKILGQNHPFLEEAARDLTALTHHPDAGDLIVSGWRLGKTSISFPLENGSHAGPGPEETRAFAFLPSSAPIYSQNPDSGYLRPLDLREGAQQLLNRHPSPQKTRIQRSSVGNLPLRIMTYNIHYCINMDGKISPSRIARVIAHYDPDIVCLQELDVRRMRTGSVDQAHFIARELEMEYHFAPALQLEEEQYGNAILSRYPMRLIHAGGLPGLPLRPDIEPRGALWVVITINGQEVQLFNTHLGLRGKERMIQVDALMGKEWLGHPDCKGPTIVCGDFNALPRSRVCRKIRRRFSDAQLTLNDHRPQRTFIGRYPVGRIDHIFISPEIKVAGVEVPRTALTQKASDHLPLIVEVDIPKL